MAKRIQGIKPYLFALVRAENSSAENRVRPALRSLELVVCDQLQLKYDYDGTEVTRDDAVCFIASRQEKRGRRTVNVGTAYLELDPTSGQPHWFPLGRQLAQFLNVPTLSDAFTMLLTAAPEDRKRMMADRQIQDSDVAEARKLLRITADEDEELSNVLDSLVPEPDDEDQREPAEVAALNQAAAASVTAKVTGIDDEPSKGFHVDAGYRGDRRNVADPLRRLGFFVENLNSETESPVHAELSDIQRWMRAFSGPTDQWSVRKARREQAILRGALGIGTGDASRLHACGLCERDVPEILVVAAHIKPRHHAVMPSASTSPTLRSPPVCSAATHSLSRAISLWIRMDGCSPPPTR
ncbi:hypothetical protein [Aeromicrobium sp.]|uniref:hypothetical protein n=1 Tax=Aeromicrobium sp. TaxID=1871063 RepID=UPI0025BE8B8C|nr:hypothetical protein [Aeromicrobium sp.]MCK5891787.1 hypothetical protein [Aeromicrobium sp.]